MSITVSEQSTTGTSLVNTILENTYALVAEKLLDAKSQYATLRLRSENEELSREEWREIESLKVKCHWYQGQLEIVDGLKSTINSSLGK